MLHISNTKILKSIYFAYFHSIITIITLYNEVWNNFWGVTHLEQKNIQLTKKIIRLMADVKPRNSCKNLFKRLEILTLPCEYIFFLMIFIVKKNKNFFQLIPIYTLLTQGIRISFIDQLPSSHISRRVLIVLALTSLTLLSNLTTLRDNQV
jgi:hypothetical protein